MASSEARAEGAYGPPALRASPCGADASDNPNPCRPPESEGNPVVFGGLFTVAARSGRFGNFKGTLK
ncbi:MAG: hypothetical protein LBT40_09195 [Deltaproteobacteria bacterium]|nr:hypothetical protein [Deltaproteobacteria bacterium]